MMLTLMHQDLGRFTQNPKARIRGGVTCRLSCRLRYVFIRLVLFSSKLIPLPVPYAPNSPHAASSFGQPKVIGPASTLRLVARDSSTVPLPESDGSAISKGQHWVDLTDQGTVVVIEQPQGQSCAAMGGIMALRMKTRGVKGCVVDGRVRDLDELKSCGLPVSSPRRSLPVTCMSTSIALFLRLL